MASGAAGDGLLRGGILEGCVFGPHTEIRRRPYHRNCSCALHKSRGLCAHASGYVHVLYPIRRRWSESCLELAASSSRPTSPPCSFAYNRCGKDTNSTCFVRGRMMRFE